MKWMLLFAVCLFTTLVVGQSTLKIYVVTDDYRSDMEIIDVNTSALERYGTSVDSTNIQYYSNMMSTQVVRLEYFELFGEEDEPVVEEAEMTAGMEDILLEDEEILASEEVEEEDNVAPVKQSTPSESVSVSRSSGGTSSSSYKTASRVKAKRVKLPQRTKRHRKFRGKCPKFF